MSGLYTIPADCCFVSTLAQGLWQRAAGDPMALARMTVYVPTRRAARHLREAFLRVTGAKAALLPRMKPLGDVDEVDLDFAGVDALGQALPAIAPLRRQMLLTRLVLAKNRVMPLEQAASLAKALAGLLDQVQTEGVSFADLHRLVPEEYAKHWQDTLAFLGLVTKLWPSVLAEEGCLDPAERRTMALEAQAQLWREAPPCDPVIAAGSTGSVPAVGRLMGVIAALPCGEVVLPGLDVDMEAQAWEAVSETHPQFMMKKWLETVGAGREEVKLWDGVPGVRRARVRL
ncbi:MAG: double-strand break repair protein AddB, partial [Bdellovibrionales bacterium]